jgi:hypothetical protein
MRVTAVVYSDGTLRYMLSMKPASNFPQTGSSWTGMDRVCDKGDGQAFRFGNIPVNPSGRAYTIRPGGSSSPLEAIIICPKYQNKYLNEYLPELDRDGLDFDALHVEIGTSPTVSQKLFGARLQTRTDNVAWLIKTFATILVHESAHAEGFVGKGNGLSTVSSSKLVADRRLLLTGSL